MAKKTNSSPQALLPRFSEGFFLDHARLMISDQRIAIVELVANAWDAGADQVDITWPVDPVPDPVVFRDNGTGMTYNEFNARWCEINYNRVLSQGPDVAFPVGNKRASRTAFGRNGKGRHSMFCFNDRYRVRTWRDGTENVFLVERSQGESPFRIVHEQQGQREGHGTEVFAELHRHHLPVSEVRDLIGSKFVADPSFRLSVNGEPVEMTDLQHLFDDTREVPIPNLGSIVIRVIDSQRRGRTSKQHGVAWWVNKRLVGEPSWRDFDEEAYLDARSAEAKRYTFIVEADLLAPYVRAEWDGFIPSGVVDQVRVEAAKVILNMLRGLLGGVHRDRKISVLQVNRSSLNGLSNGSLDYIGKVVDSVQDKYPSFGERELNATVSVIANLEKSRNGFSLLEQLSALSPDDLDQLGEILGKWSVQEAQIVLNELEKRLKLIVNLEKLVENPSADELHDLQPLFERGLWIFGPEYESLEFTSNRTLVTVLKKLFETDTTEPLENPRRRPDFVVLPNSNVGVYSRDSFDKQGGVNGIAKVMIVELKRGGFEVTHEEVSQAEAYIRELRKGQRVQRSSQIVAFVLGTTLSEDAEEKTMGDQRQSVIYPTTYSTVLRMAHSRTFQLLRSVKSFHESNLTDPEVGLVMGIETRNGSAKPTGA